MGKIKAAKLTTDEFKTLLEKVIEEKVEGYYKERIKNYSLEDKVGYILEELKSEEEDGVGINRIEFDLENYDAETGVESIGGLHYIGVTAGGDWEHPIYFILYFDENKQLKGYIPENGNIYNKKLKSAFGNNAREDYYFDYEKMQRIPYKPEEIEYSDVDAAKEQYGIEANGEYADLDSIDHDFEKMNEEIKNNIEVVEC